MNYTQGDRVHVASLGTGTIREVRNSGRYLVDVNGRSLVVAGGQLEPAAPARRPRAGRTTGATNAGRPAGPAANRPAVPTLDLHGKTVVETLAALDGFLNEVLLAGAEEVRVIHGRGGGRLKDAVHRRLGQIPSIRGFRQDPRNAGMTIVTL